MVLLLSSSGHSDDSANCFSARCDSLQDPQAERCSPGSICAVREGGLKPLVLVAAQEKFCPVILYKRRSKLWESSKAFTSQMVRHLAVPGLRDGFVSLNCIDMLNVHLCLLQASAVVAGFAVGAAAYAGKAAIELFAKYRSAPPRLRQFYKVRFQLLFCESTSQVWTGEAKRVIHKSCQAEYRCPCCWGLAPSAVLSPCREASCLR